MIREIFSSPKTVELDEALEKQQQRERDNNVRRFACLLQQNDPSMSPEACLGEAQRIEHICFNEKSLSLVYKEIVLNHLTRLSVWGKVAASIKTDEHARYAVECGWKNVVKTFRGDANNTQLTQYYVWFITLGHFLNTKLVWPSARKLFDNTIKIHPIYRVVIAHENLVFSDCLTDAHSVNTMLESFNSFQPVFAMYIFAHHPPPRDATERRRRQYMECAQTISSDHPPARLHLANAYFTGIGLTHSFEKAIKFGMDPILCTPMRPSYLAANVILSTILQGTEKDPVPVFTDKRDAFKLRRVCKEWNRIILKLNRFWLRFNVEPHPGMSYEKEGLGPYVIDQLHYIGVLKRAEREEDDAIERIDKYEDKLSSARYKLKDAKRQLTKARGEKLLAIKKIKRHV